MSYFPKATIKARRQGIIDQSIEIFLYEKTNDNMVAIANPVVFQVKHYNDASECGPTMRLAQETAQTLMDELWLCGLRPSEGSGSAGSLAATQKHLEDMRTLVFKTHP